MSRTKIRSRTRNEKSHKRKTKIKK